MLDQEILWYVLQILCSNSKLHKRVLLMASKVSSFLAKITKTGFVSEQLTEDMNTELQQYQEDIAHLVHSYGIDVNSKNAQRKTALEYAAKIDAEVKKFATLRGNWSKLEREIPFLPYNFVDKLKKQNSK